MNSLITDSASLESLCNEASQQPFITIDTEFLREKTYWPKLCLVQIGLGHAAYAVDPLAEDIDLEPLWKLLKNPNVLKVMHAARQDMEIFYDRMGEVAKPVFDTQIAAKVCGLGENVGYETLVKKLLGQGLDKSERFSDWSKRPLTESQIHYALGDVTHLYDAYLKMVKLMEKHGRAHWIEEEMEALHDPSLYVTRPEEAWQRIKFRATKRQQLGRLQALAAWRESLAQTENIPRGRVIKDEALISLASLSPESPQAMMQLRGFPQHLKKNWREQLWKLVEEIKDISAEDSPQITRAKQISHIAQARLDLLNLLLKNCAREADVTPKLVAEKAWVESLAEGERAPEHPLMHGWRYELFGKKAVALIEGKVQMSLDPRTGMLLISDS